MIVMFVSLQVVPWDIFRVFFFFFFRNWEKQGRSKIEVIKVFCGFYFWGEIRESW